MRATRMVLLAALAVCTEAAAQGAIDLVAEPAAMALDEVIGVEVRAPDGRVLGRIRELLLHPTTGNIDSIALAPQGSAHPVSALLAGDNAGEVLLVPSDSSSAGATTLAPETPLRSSRTLGAGATVDLLNGRIVPPLVPSR